MEALSFLLLVLIAMPLKYFFGFPEAVKYVGWAHGLLFVVYAGALVFIGIDKSWPFWKMLVLFLAAFLPLGPVAAERWLKGWANIESE